jgi:hypothetical protein
VADAFTIHNNDGRPLGFPRTRGGLITTTATTGPAQIDDHVIREQMLAILGQEPVLRISATDDRTTPSHPKTPGSEPDPIDNVAFVKFVRQRCVALRRAMERTPLSRVPTRCPISPLCLGPPMHRPCSAPDRTLLGSPRCGSPGACDGFSHERLIRVEGLEVLLE